MINLNNCYIKWKCQFILNILDSNITSYRSRQYNMEEKQRNVKVVCRFRPLNQREKAISNTVVNQLLDDKTVVIKQNKLDKGNQENPTFSFDRVFNSDCTQKQVYTYAAESVIESVIQGFNGTIFAYGQTSSGKTFTMQGQIAKEITQDAGIIPRMVRQVFQSINQSSENVQFRIKVSIVELYMEKLRDLMDSNKADLKIRSDKKKGIYIQNLTEIYISTPQEIYELMEVARSTRAIASTNMNERSSRSHMLFILTISQNNLDDMSAKTGKLYLVDLAGSQKIGKTGAEGKTLDQAKKINISLTALGKVINALTDGRSTHVPYRDSKLTRVLQESLGGNSKTSLIVTCSPHPNNMAETISTLRFGVSAKKIKNKPKINKQMTVAQLQNMLDKTQKELEERVLYINQLKNYITVDLKVKTVPEFCSESVSAIRVQEENDLIAELERQLEIERNFSAVQGEELATYKEKHDKLYAEKEALESQLNKAREELKEKAKFLTPSPSNAKHHNSPNNVEAKGQNKSKEASTIEGSTDPIQQFLGELKQLTNDQNVIKFCKQKLPTLSFIEMTSNSDLVASLNEEHEKREEAEKKFQNYERTMQKKLNQLENNICQLTHAYYDLLIIQQRHKVDNIFLKKKIDEKDSVVDNLKRKIKDLEDINRELEERGWEGNEGDSDKRLNSKYLPSMEQEDKLNQLLQERNMALPSQNPKVVKVVRGGHK